jgi:hypothetical protein
MNEPTGFLYKLLASNSWLSSPDLTSATAQYSTRYQLESPA